MAKASRRAKAVDFTRYAFDHCFEIALAKYRSGTVVYAGVPFFFLARHTIHRAMAKETNKSKSSRNSAIVREHP